MSNDEIGATDGEPDPAAALASEIRRRRRAAGLSHAELAKTAGFTREYVRQSEQATRGLPSETLVDAIDDALGAGGALKTLRAAAYQDRLKRRPATTARTTQKSASPTPKAADRDRSQHSLGVPSVVPYLMASGAAATGASSSSPEADEGMIDSASDRTGVLDPYARRVLSRGDSSPDHGHEMHELELTRLHGVDRAHGAYDALVGVVAVLRSVESDLARRRGKDRRAFMRVAARAAEFAGFLQRDLGDMKQSLFWHDRAMEWAQQSGDAAMQAFVLLRKAQAAYDHREAARMLDLTMAALQYREQLGGGLIAELTQQRARGEAMLGGPEADIRQLLDVARESIDFARRRSPDEPCGNYAHRQLDLQTALCMVEAGRPAEASALYEPIVASEASERDRAYYSMLMAIALGLSGEPDAAAAIGCSALPAATSRQSGRTLREGYRLVSVLAPRQQRSAVRDLADALSTAQSSSR